jgi:hypothetical protein
MIPTRLNIGKFSLENSPKLVGINSIIFLELAELARNIISLRRCWMRKVIAVVLILSFFVIYAPVFAREEGVKSAATKAYEHASDESIFNRVSDWFATLGKSDQEKTQILAERKAKRAAEKAAKAAKKAKKQAAKEAKEAAKKAEEKKKLHKKLGY